MIYINGSPLNVTIFPDKTSQVWHLDETLLKETNYFHITWEFSHEGELMHLAQLSDLLRQYRAKTTLRIKYLPYGRQDKNISNESTFALVTFAALLAVCEFDEVIIHDPHSEKALEYIENSRAIYPVDQVTDVFKITESNVMCFPDKGAKEKYSYIYSEKFTYGLDYAYGQKVRNQKTGLITRYELEGNCKGKKVLIVDDICDGGATFVLLAKELLAAGATEINLFVTHGIFSKGLEPLFKSGIKRIFTQDGEASEVENQITYRRL